MLHISQSCLSINALILCSHLCLCLPDGPFLQVFQTKQEDPDLNIGIVIDYAYDFCGFLETVQAKAGTVPEIRTRLFPRLSLLITLPLIILLFDPRYSNL
jgi:hypothetical protein